METKRSPEETTVPEEKDGETAVVEPNVAPMLVASIEPPVTVRPETVERPPAVEMETPPLNDEVAALVTLSMPSAVMPWVAVMAPVTPRAVPGVRVAMPVNPF